MTDLQLFYSQVVPAGKRALHVTAVGGRFDRTYSVPSEKLVEYVLQEDNRLKDQFICWEVLDNPNPAENQAIYSIKRDVSERERGTVESFTLDFDLIEEGTQLHASEEALVQYLEQQIAEGIIPEPNWICESGSGGRHLWYILQNALDPAAWKDISAKIRKTLKDQGILLDTNIARTAQNIIRVPGSFNCKNAPKEVILERRSRRPFSHTRLCNLFGIQSDAVVVDPAMQSLRREIAQESRREFESNLPLRALKSCKLAFSALNDAQYGVTLSYSQWLGLGTIVRHMHPRATEAFIKVTRAYHNKHGKGGDPERLAIKAIEIEHGALEGPMNCAYMLGDPDARGEQLLELMKAHPHCSSCSACDRVKKGGMPQPLWRIDRAAELLRSKEARLPAREAAESQNDEIPTRAQRSAELAETTLPETIINYYALPDNLPMQKQAFYYVPDQDEPDKRVRVTDQVWWVRELLENETHGTLSYALCSANGREVVAPERSLNDVKILGETLSGLKVGMQDSKRAKDLFQLMLKYTSAPTITAYEKLGWKPDKVFVDYRYKYNGKSDPEEARFTSIAESQFTGQHVSNEGTLAGWGESIAPALRPGGEVMAMALFYALGSVLIQPLELHNEVAVLSLFSTDSGTGKTTCLRLASSIWGTPARSHTGYRDTENSVAVRLGYMQHLPVCIDEITTLEDADKQDFIYRVVQGAARRGLRVDNTQRDARDWNLACLMSSNESFWVGLSEGNKAAMDRVLEIELHRPILSMHEADEMLAGLDQNHGVLGPAFVLQLQKLNWTQLRSIYRQLQKQLRASLSGYSNDDRFIVNASALALLAARLCWKYLPDVGVDELGCQRLQRWVTQNNLEAARSRDLMQDLGGLDTEDLLLYVKPHRHELDGQPVVMGTVSPDHLICWRDEEGDLLVRQDTVRRWLNDLRHSARAHKVLSGWQSKGKAEHVRKRVKLPQDSNEKQMRLWRISDA